MITLVKVVSFVVRVTYGHISLNLKSLPSDLRSILLKLLSLVSENSVTEYNIFSNWIISSKASLDFRRPHIIKSKKSKDLQSDEIIARSLNNNVYLADPVLIWEHFFAFLVSRHSWTFLYHARSSLNIQILHKLLLTLGVQSNSPSL